MDSHLPSNVEIYKAIANEAYQKMVHFTEAGRRPKTDGSPGWIFTLDPNQNSFKQSMISIVFTGIWLEAYLHLLIVKKFDVATFKKVDKDWSKGYNEKLQLLGCTDQEILTRASRFRKTRTNLVHEKAHLDDGEIKAAQDEAESAHEMLVAVSNHFSEQLP